MTVKPLIFAASLLAMSGCGPTLEATMVHPQTGATAQCSASTRGFIDRIAGPAAFDECIKKYEAQGYVRQDSE